VSTRQDGVELFFTSSNFPRDSFTSRSATYDEKVIVWDVNNFSLMENITVNGHVSDLAFSADGFYLKTNNGSFKLKSAVGVSYDENDCFLRLAIRRHWISRHRHKTIWLPQELRRYNYAASVCGPFMALGHSSGTVPPWEHFPAPSLASLSLLSGAFTTTSNWNRTVCSIDREGSVLSMLCWTGATS
jgi:WD40 repeat protein